MYLIIFNSKGLRQECLLLSAGLDHLRLAVPGEKDAVELIRNGGQWMWEGDEAVELESMLCGELPEAPCETQEELEHAESSLESLAAV